MSSSYQNWYQGATFPAWTIPLATDSANDNITGISTGQISVIFHPNSGSDFTGTGTVAITTANPAVITYTPSTTDVANAFNGQLFVKAIFPGGGIAIYDPISFVITAI